MHFFLSVTHFNLCTNIFKIRFVRNLHCSLCIPLYSNSDLIYLSHFEIFKTSDVTKEELVEFRIPCESNAQAAELNKLFRNLKDNGVVINLDGNLPNKNENSEFLKVTVLNTPQQLMEKYHSAMKPTTKEAPKA